MLRRTAALLVISLATVAASPSPPKGVAPSVSSSQKGGAVSDLRNSLQSAVQTMAGHSIYTMNYPSSFDKGNDKGDKDKDKDKDGHAEHGHGGGDHDRDHDRDKECKEHKGGRDTPEDCRTGESPD